MLAGLLETMTTMPDRPLYEDDFYAWTRCQATVLRTMAAAELGLRSCDETQAADNLPTDCPYTIDEILRRGWYPEPPGEQP
jgi:hypothetical protein